MLDIEKTIIILISFIIFYFTYIYYENRNHTYTQSNDGHLYRVQNDKDSDKVANLIALIVANNNLLITHLEKIAPDDQRTLLLKNRYNPRNITEGNNDTNLTSYSINKGEKIVLCLRSKDEERKLVDINTMMFVTIHELGHLTTDSIGHNPDFWENFKWLLEEAINIGIYKYEDYENEPIKYCGIKISSSVIDKS
jgi:predicted metal-dependent hydrolase